ncbi:MAG: class I SAM-dependent methyltransferase [Bacteroidia bacterium]|nr:class I SAM-dependent methyltransferase [Bacteroidia bacterium]
MHKDNFSNVAVAYAKYRPAYPAGLVAEIIALTKDRQLAWDCACGNGQMATLLSPYFDEVFASDISNKQLAQAIAEPKIRYVLEPAELSSLANQSADLITIAQAFHWFKFNDFYAEVKRVLKPGGVIAAIGYGLLKINEPLDKIISRFYTEILGPYWDAERRHVDNAYKDIPFPFNEVNMGKYCIHARWTVDQVLGYLGTWSAVQHYKSNTGINPLNLIEKEIRTIAGNTEMFTIEFPVFARVGRWLP